MVAFCDYDDDSVENPKTLTDWVRNFRLKRVQMRRKLRGAGSDLRVTAILSTALLHAEQELRHKQQERFSRWLEMQAKFVPHGRTHCGSDSNSNFHLRCDDDKVIAKRREVENLWKSELSGLDDFMRSLSGSSDNNNSSSSIGNSNEANSGDTSSSYYNNNSNSHHQHQCAIAVHS